MILIHFLKRSSSIFWMIALLVSIGWIAANPINGYTANAEGLYSGTFSGERNGTMFLLTDGSSKGQIYFWITAEQVIDTGKINVNSQGGFTFKCTYGLAGNGSIKPDGNVTGSWKVGGTTGNLKGVRQDSSKLKNLAGTYSSDLTGNETGELNLTVAINGSIKGTVRWDKNNLVEEGSGIVNSKGIFIFHTQDDTSIYGTIKSSGDVYGNWNNPFWETKGTLGDTPTSKNAVKSNNAAGDESMPVYVETQQDNTNGCFIRTMTPSY